MSDKVKIYYLGSGKLGCRILDAILADERIELCGVGSQPDRPVGRKQTITPTDFASYALNLGMEVDRLPNVNAPEFLEKLEKLGIELLLVVAFGQLLKTQLLNLPKYGCLNVHASLLPRYRGSCPIINAILNGDSETGVTFMAIDKGLDTGPIYQSFSLPILENEYREQLGERLAKLSAEHIGNLLWSIARENRQATPQPPTTESYVRKISKSDAAVKWQVSALRIYRMILAYTPWPKVFTVIPSCNGTLRKLQIIQATAERLGESCGEPGEVLAAPRGQLLVACGDGCLRIQTVVPEGKREMTADAFLRGNPLPPGTILPSINE